MKIHPILIIIFLVLALSAFSLAPQADFVQFADDANDSSFNTSAWGSGGAPTETNDGILVASGSDSFWTNENFTVNDNILFEAFAYDATAINTAWSWNVGSAELDSTDSMCAVAFRGSAGLNQMTTNHTTASATNFNTFAQNGSYYQLVLNTSTEKCEFWYSNVSFSVDPHDRRLGGSRYADMDDDFSKMIVGWRDFGPAEYIVRGIRVFNGSLAPPADLSPPNITRATYNVTSAYADATAWATDTTAVVGTRDPTSTVNFTISEVGNCSISLNATNYTDMTNIDPNTQCATIEATTHTCTPPATEALSDGDNDIFISCIDLAGNEFENSSSGPLRINLDDVPPIIDSTTYNVPNAYDNETIWQSSIASVCRIRTRLASVNFSVGEVSNCSISLNQSNYTEMTSIDINTRCGTLDAKKHQCALPITEALSDGRQGLFISCIDPSGNQEDGGNSTSGNLTIAMDFSMSGKVTYPDGSDFAGADVVIMNTFNHSKEGNQTTNVTGDWRQFIPERGNYTVTAQNNTNSSLKTNISAFIEVI